MVPRVLPNRRVRPSCSQHDTHRTRHTTHTTHTHTGFADLAGRKYGGAARLPHNRSKSWAGSCAFFVASLAFQCAYAHLFHTQGWLRVGLAQSLPTIVAVTLVSTVVESLPVSDWDNLTVSLAAWGCHRLLGSV